MMLILADLELWTRIGLTDAERSSEQRVLVSVDLTLRDVKAETTDEVADSVDYEEVVKTIRDTGKEERKTMEKLAGDIAEKLLNITKVERVAVTVKKRILPSLTEASVRVER